MKKKYRRFSRGNSPFVIAQNKNICYRENDCGIIKSSCALRRAVRTSIVIYSDNHTFLTDVIFVIFNTVVNTCKLLRIAFDQFKRNFSPKIMGISPKLQLNWIVDRTGTGFRAKQKEIPKIKFISMLFYVQFVQCLLHFVFLWVQVDGKWQTVFYYGEPLRNVSTGILHSRS